MLIVFTILAVIILLIIAFLFGGCFGMVASVVSLDASLEKYGTTPDINSFKSIYKRVIDEHIRPLTIELIKNKVEKYSEKEESK